MDGDGKKMDQAPPLRNPFVHVLKLTPLEKAKVNEIRFWEMANSRESS